jgi:hypothetical protein
MVVGSDTITADENAVDTAVDLYIYALKYLTYLADIDAAAVPELPAPDPNEGPWSNGHRGVDRLLDHADLVPLDTPRESSVCDLARAVERAFADLEACFPEGAPPAPPATRARLARRLADLALQTVGALRVAQPETYRQFLQMWKVAD